MKLTKKNTPEEIKSLLEEASNTNTDNLRLQQIWGLTTSPKVRFEVIKNENLDLEFLKKPSVIKVAAAYFFENPAVEFLALFDKLNIFNAAQQQVLSCIQEINSGGTTKLLENNYMFKTLMASSCYAFIRPVVRAVLNSNIPTEVKMGFLAGKLLDGREISMSYSICTEVNKQLEAKKTRVKLFSDIQKYLVDEAKKIKSLDAKDKVFLRRAFGQIRKIYEKPNASMRLSSTYTREVISQILVSKINLDKAPPHLAQLYFYRGISGIMSYTLNAV